MRTRLRTRTGKGSSPEAGSVRARARARWGTTGLRTLLGLLVLAGCSSPGAGTAPAQPVEGAAADAGTPGSEGKGDGAGNDEAAEAGAGNDEAAEAGEGKGEAAGAGETAQADEPAKPPPHEDPWLVELLAADPKIARLMKDPARYRLQILVTVIAPKGSKGPAMEEHGYRADAEYVYPASAIKTFAAVGALRKLEALRNEGHKVGLDTPLAYCEGTSCQTEDASNLEGGTITIGHEIRKMQLVSNNVSFNRLYELVGHRELNEDMWSLGFPSVRIHHRMYGVQDPLVQRTTPRVELRAKRGKRVVLPGRVSDLVMPDTEAGELRIGVAYIDDATGARVDEPLDFSGKNYASVRDLHRLTLALARPELPGVPDLGLREADREFLLAAMTEDPLASKNPVYTDEHDSGLRYHTMIKGMMKVMPLERILYTGKAGKAYGFHLDNAYVQDRKSGRAMVVTVVGYANANGVLNDNIYEYDGVTRPLLLGLGTILGRAVLLGEALPAAAAAPDR
jgi:hypothetical protein